MTSETFFSFLTASALLTVMPGPDIIYVIMQSITNGKKYGYATALGLVTGIIIHTLLIAIGLSSLIKQNESIFFIIKLFGALYLFYLAYMVYKSSKSLELDTKSIELKSVFKLFQQGFLMNILNPKVTLFFLAFLPNFIDTTKNNVIQQTISLGLLFMLQALIIFSLFSFIADKMTVLLRNNKSFEKYLKISQIIIYCGIGIFILF